VRSALARSSAYFREAIERQRPLTVLAGLHRRNDSRYMSIRPHRLRA
jgi:hypothetical protein